MSEDKQKALALVGDALAGNDLAAIRHLWAKRFGRKLETYDQVTDWLCTEGGMNRSTAADVSLRDAVRMLQGPDTSCLKQVEREILAVLDREEFLSGREIEDKLNGLHSNDVIRKHLRPAFPLRSMGFVEMKDNHRGYRRLM